jgi:hypothetical protein
VSLTIKEPKSLWRVIMDLLTPRPPRKTPAQFINEHHTALQSALAAELAGNLVAALFAKKTLDTTRQVDIPFPDAYLAGEKPIDEIARAELTAYVAELERFQSELLENDTPVTVAVARGLTTWIASIYTLTEPEMGPKGKDIWQRLLTAEDGIVDGYKFLLRREPTDVERSYFSYRPTVFL